VVQVDGSYRFGQVDMPAGRIFIVSIEHQGEVFNSAPSLHPGEEQILVDGILQLSIHISDQSTDASALYVERMHVFLDFSIPGTVQIVELFLITNPTNSIITASDPAIGVISFDLPKGAQNLQFQDSVLGERYLPTENGFSDTRAIQPGPASHQVLFAYEFPYNGSLDLSIPLPMPVNTVSLMVPFEGIKVKSDQLADGGLKDSQGMSFHLYTAANLAPSSPLEFSVTGKVKTTGAQSGIQVNGILFGAGLFVLALTGVGYFFYRKMRPVEKEESRTESKNKDEIMDAIIALDDLHKSGKLSSDAYQQRRNELKSRLKEIL
jgi:hypothetical protein